MIRMRSLLLVILSLIVVSCSQTAIYDSSVVVENEELNRDSVAVFEVGIADTAQLYNIAINIRNTTEYRFQNIYIFADIIAPNGAVQRDTVECFLADNAGRWLGKGHGALRDNRFVYRRGVKFATRGSYTFRLQQAMRVNPLQGIANIGIRVEELEAN